MSKVDKSEGYIPGPFERLWLDLREWLRIDIYCDRCNDLCHGKEQRKARLCQFDLDQALDRQNPPPDPWANSPFNADVIKPGDPAWAIFEQAMKGDGGVVVGTYDTRTGEVVAMDTSPPSFVHTLIPSGPLRYPGGKDGMHRVHCSQGDYTSGVHPTPERAAKAGQQHCDAKNAQLPQTQSTTPFPYACCWTCTPDYQFMLVCQECGNKRCPHANDHRNECTGSNEPGQPGSAYPDNSPLPPKETDV